MYYKYAQYIPPNYPVSSPEFYRGDDLYRTILNQLIKGTLLGAGTAGTLSFLRQRELKKALYSPELIARKAIIRARIYNELLPILALGSLAIPIIPTIVDIIRSRSGYSPPLPGISPFPYMSR